jgi:hypothetical protein
MFQEYVGSSVLIVVWQIVTIIICLTWFSKYLMCLLAQEFQENAEQDEGFSNEI